MAQEEKEQVSDEPRGQADLADQVADAADAAYAEAAAETQPDLQAEMQRLEDELAAAHDRALRAHAELDNYRKRTARQMEEERKYATLTLVRDLLPVVDNLERAMQAAEQNQNGAGLLQGVTLVVQQLASVLERHDCQRIDAKGSAFDPHLHNAIGQMPSAELPAGVVAEVALAGYRMHDRVVRPAQVLVSTGLAPAEAPTDASHPADPTDPSVE
jgi:molecular chaperone GrpE